MVEFAEKCIDLINNGQFQFDDVGPLHSPIKSFSLKRDDKLRLKLDTVAPPDATSAAKAYPAGTVRFTTERATLTGLGTSAAALEAIIPASVNRTWNGPDDGAIKETSQVAIASVTIRECAQPSYMIEWLENLPSDPYIWPDMINVEEQTTIVRQIGSSGSEVTIPDSGNLTSHSRAAARLTVSGLTFSVCALDKRDYPGSTHPGCIVYEGTPGESFRRKIRYALSLALGVYLVELGHSLYSAEWHLVHAMARSAYTLSGRAFDIGTEQPAPLGEKYIGLLGRVELNRAVAKLVENYDALDLGNLSWAYWQARTATPHIAPAHFGAAVEALLRSFIGRKPNPISDTWLEKPKWKCLRAELNAVLNKSGTTPEVREALARGIVNMNNIDFRTRLKRVLDVIGLQLGDDENRAWRRRNFSAHGMPIPQGEELAAIRDMKLLKGLFNRLQLRITDASDHYIDYATPTHPYRPLKEAPANLPLDRVD